MGGGLDITHYTWGSLLPYCCSICPARGRGWVGVETEKNLSYLLGMLYFHGSLVSLSGYLSYKCPFIVVTSKFTCDLRPSLSVPTLPENHVEIL